MEIPKDQLIDAIKNFVKINESESEKKYSIDLDRVGVLAKFCGYQQGRDLFKHWGLWFKEDESDQVTK